MNSKDSNCLQFRWFFRKKIMRMMNKDASKKNVESQVIQILNKTSKYRSINWINIISIINNNSIYTDYSLNIVNRYKENIVHISAANNCVEIIKCILQNHDKKCLERKNAFGWTPLMQAIRNENTQMVKFLLNLGVIVNDFSFLGIQIIVYVFILFYFIYCL
jgi:ankyrin repeat protein